MSFYQEQKDISDRISKLYKDKGDLLLKEIFQMKSPFLTEQLKRFDEEFPKESTSDFVQFSGKDSQKQDGKPPIMHDEIKSFLLSFYIASLKREIGELRDYMNKECICNHSDPKKCFPIIRCACKMHGRFTRKYVLSDRIAQIEGELKELQ